MKFKSNQPDGHVWENDLSLSDGASVGLQFTLIVMYYTLINVKRTNLLGEMLPLPNGSTEILEMPVISSIFPNYFPLCHYFSNFL